MRKILAFGSNAVGLLVDDEDVVFGTSDGEKLGFLDASELKILGMVSSNGRFIYNENDTLVDNEDTPLGYVESRGMKILVYDDVI